MVESDYPELFDNPQSVQSLDNVSFSPMSTVA